MAMGHFRFMFSLAAAVATVASSAMFTLSAALDRGRDALLAFTDLVLSLAFPSHDHLAGLAFAYAREGDSGLGLHQTRSYQARRLARVGDQRSRAPDSVAFVTA